MSVYVCVNSREGSTQRDAHTDTKTQTQAQRHAHFHPRPRPQVRELREQVEARDASLAAMEGDLRAVNVDELLLVAATQYQELQRLRDLLEQQQARTVRVDEQEGEDVAGADGPFAHGVSVDATGASAVPLAAALRAAKEDNKVLVARVRALQKDLANAQGVAASLQQQLDGTDLKQETAAAFAGVTRGALIERLLASEASGLALASENKRMAEEFAVLQRHSADLPALAHRMELMQARQADLLAAKEEAMKALHRERAELQSLVDAQRSHLKEAEKIDAVTVRQMALLADKEKELAALQQEREHAREAAARAVEQQRAGEMLLAQHGKLVAEAERETARLATTKEKQDQELRQQLELLEATRTKEAAELAREREALLLLRSKNIQEIDGERSRWVAEMEKAQAERAAAARAKAEAAARAKAKKESAKGFKGFALFKRGSSGGSEAAPDANDNDPARIQAAIVFQSHWRRHKAQESLASLKATDAVVRVQAALRGHLARRRLVAELAGRGIDIKSG